MLHRLCVAPVLCRFRFCQSSSFSALPSTRLFCTPFDPSSLDDWIDTLQEHILKFTLSKQSAAGTVCSSFPFSSCFSPFCPLFQVSSLEQTLVSALHDTQWAEDEDEDRMIAPTDHKQSPHCVRNVRSRLPPVVFSLLFLPRLSSSSSSLCLSACYFMFIVFAL